MPKSQARAFTAIALAVIASVGLWEGSRGVLLPHFLADLKLSATVGGAVFSSTAMGYLISSLCFGVLSHRFGLKRLVGGGLLLLSTAMALFVTLRLPALLYAVNILLGASISVLEMSTSIQISLIYKERQGGMLNLLHGFFGGGALLGSLWAAFWVSIGAGWQVPFALVAVLLVLVAGPYLMRPVPPLPKQESGPSGYGPLLKDPLVWAAALGLFCAVVGEVGGSLWLPSYLQKMRGMTEPVSAGYMTAFFAGFTATRLAGSWLVVRVGQVRTVFGLALVGLAGLCLMLVLDTTPLILPILAGAGIATGFATCTALVADRYPERVNQVYSVMYASGGLAGMVTGPAMGWLGDRSSLSAAMWVPVTGYAMLAALMVYYGLAGGRRRPAVAPLGD